MKAVTKWSVVMGLSLLGNGAFAQNLQCDRFEYDRSLTKVSLKTDGNEVQFSFERNSRSDGGFLAASAKALSLPFEKNDDSYRVTFHSVGAIGTEVGANPLLGYITLWYANSSKFEAALTRTSAGGTQTFPLKAGYLHLNTEKVTHENVHNKTSSIVVAINMAVMPWTNFIESIPFADGECRPN